MTRIKSTQLYPAELFEMVNKTDKTLLYKL